MVYQKEVQAQFIERLKEEKSMLQDAMASLIAREQLLTSDIRKNQNKLFKMLQKEDPQIAFLFLNSFDYETLLFDLDDTLIDNRASMENAFRAVATYFHKLDSRRNTQGFYEFDSFYWKDHQKGHWICPATCDTVEKKTTYLRAMRFFQYFEDISMEEAVAMNQYFYQVSEEHIVLLDGAEELVSYLDNSKRYRSYIITNGALTLACAKVKALSSRSFPNGILTSEEVGCSKPNTQFMETFYQRYPDEKCRKTLLIGDGLSTDILLANRVGLDSCWVNFKGENNETTMIPTYECSHIKELIKKL